MTTSEMGKLYDTVMSIPGMNEPVKIDLRMSRKLVLLMNQVLETGLRQGGGENEALSFYPKEAAEELKQLIGEGLEKAGLTELYGKLKSFQAT